VSTEDKDFVEPMVSDCAHKNAERKAMSVSNLIKNFLCAAWLGINLSVQSVAAEESFKLPEWIGIPDDVLIDFKDANLLQDSFDAPAQVVVDKAFSIGNETLSFHSTDVTAVQNIFLAEAEYHLDGVKQNSLPAAAVYLTNADPTVLVTKNSMGELERATKIDPVTGESVALIPMEIDSQFFVEVVRHQD
jgi:hypothetical protein